MPGSRNMQLPDCLIGNEGLARIEVVDNRRKRPRGS